MAALHRTISAEQDNAEVAASLLRTKSVEKNAGAYYKNIAAASTAALSSLSYAASEGEVSAAALPNRWAVPVDLGLKNEEYAMMAEEQAVMDRCAFLNNGCSDYPTATFAVKGAVNDSYANWVSEHDHGYDSKAGDVPTVPKNRDFGPCVNEVTLDANMSEYAIMKANREKYFRWENALGAKMAAKELAIESKYEVLNNGCSYGGVDSLNRC